MFVHNRGMAYEEVGELERALDDCSRYGVIHTFISLYCSPPRCGDQQKTRFTTKKNVGNELWCLINWSMVILSIYIFF